MRVAQSTSENSSIWFGYGANMRYIACKRSALQQLGEEGCVRHGACLHRNIERLPRTCPLLD
eukprot:2921408-Amphidinium_carterae.1